MAPRERQLPGARPTATKEATVDTTKSSARDAGTAIDRGDELGWQEERYRHELMGEEERLEPLERILRLRKKLATTAQAR